MWITCPKDFISFPHLSPSLPIFHRFLQILLGFPSDLSANACLVAGYKTPIVADIHFTPKVALVCADFVDKVEPVDR